MRDKRVVRPRSNLSWKAVDHHRWYDIALENSEELKKVFGCSDPKKDVAIALGCLAYGPLNHAIYDCQIAPYATDERDFERLHMFRLKELGLGGNLPLFDRGTPPRISLPILLRLGFLS